MGEDRQMTIEKQTATSIVTWRRESHLGLKMSYPDSYQVTMGKENLIDSHLFPLKFCSCSQVFLSCKTLKALSSSNVTNGEVPCSKLHGKCSTCVCVCAKSSQHINMWKIRCRPMSMPLLNSNAKCMTVGHSTGRIFTGDLR